MSNSGKILALDYGSKKVGVAVSDSSRDFCFIRPYIANRGDLDELLSQIRDICVSEAVSKIVVGVPYMNDMSETAQTARNLAFVESLRAFVSLPVEIFDESFSTFEAKKMIEAYKLKGEKEADLKDSFSAFVILQRYLEKK